VDGQQQLSSQTSQLLLILPTGNMKPLLPRRMRLLHSCLLILVLLLHCC